MTAYSPVVDPTAVMGRRIGAFIVDGIIGTILMAIVLIPAFQSASVKHDMASADDARSYCDTYKQNSNHGCFAFGSTVYTIAPNKMKGIEGEGYGVYFLFGLADFVLLQGLTGASLGKFLFGLRVVRGEPGGSMQRAGIGWCALRWVLLIFVDNLCCLIGLITSLSSNGHRRVGDMAATTLVVSAKYVGVTPGAPGQGAGAWSAPPAGGGWVAPGQAPGGPAGWAAPTAPTAPGAAPGAPAGDGPTWDAQRNTYIQYDRAQSTWLQWDDTSKEWKPIS